MSNECVQCIECCLENPGGRRLLTKGFYGGLLATNNLRGGTVDERSSLQVCPANGGGETLFLFHV